MNTKIITFIFSVLFASFGTAHADSSIDDLWKKRAKAAASNLLNSDLDQCDKALETAYSSIQTRTMHGQQVFDMNITIQGETMKLAYVYEKENLSQFLVVTQPFSWVAKHNLSSNQVSMLVGSARCAFDICLSNPLNQGACT